jgi:hypothetical protein
MGKIGYGYGSEWHLLRYLGYHRDELSGMVLKETGGEFITWLDFGYKQTAAPLNYDRELVGLDFIHDAEVIRLWKAFWPQTGNAQNWDAVGKIEFGNHEEWLLVEAKAHLYEVVSHCGAKSENSLDQIKLALEKTMRDFCDPPIKVENWLSPYYQYANRLAVLFFLMREVQPVIPARLLFIYFTGDQRKDEVCPKGKEEWQIVIEEMEERLGVNPVKELTQRVHHLFLPVNPENNQALI